MYKVWLAVLQEHTALSRKLPRAIPPPWPTPEALDHYLGPRIKGEPLSKRQGKLPHGPGNTCWAADIKDTEEAREMRKARKRSLETPEPPPVPRRPRTTKIRLQAALRAMGKL